ncbi:sterol desaturase family protein [Lacinutrix mariniflava]|uniref:sterol desaturase family protein n=1 Tax=Lacinutrix mariniflava TaxID=342955 RepID=UPI0006E1625D|nr:sterol desaturase family protein [Lacinutrix mariniflava]
MASLKDLNTFWSVLICANILMYLFTILISYSWSKINKYKTLELTKHDIYNSLIVVFINILVAIPGYLLFKNGVINFTINSSYIRDLMFLFFFLDLLMYLLHLVSHYIWPFKKFHNKHHSHKYFNAISLYVMEPVEAILFGVLITICAYLFQFNFYSFLTFLFLNWALGVIGHLNTNSTKQPILFGNHVFHKTHHQQANKNFGFYTVIWDRIFGTFYKKSIKKAKT